MSIIVAQLDNSYLVPTSLDGGWSSFFSTPPGSDTELIDLGMGLQGIIESVTIELDTSVFNNYDPSIFAQFLSAPFIIEIFATNTSDPPNDNNVVEWAASSANITTDDKFFSASFAQPGYSSNFDDLFLPGLHYWLLIDDNGYGPIGAYGSATLHESFFEINSPNGPPVIDTANSFPTGTVNTLPFGTVSAASDKTSGVIAFSDSDITTTTVSVSQQTVVYEGANGATYTLTSAEMVAIEQAFSISLTPGSGNNGNIHWAYSIPDEELNFLGVGETLTLTSEIQISDGQGGTTNQNVVVNISAPAVPSGTLAGDVETAEAMINAQLQEGKPPPPGQTDDYLNEPSLVAMIASDIAQMHNSVGQYSGPNSDTSDFINPGGLSTDPLVNPDYDQCVALVLGLAFGTDQTLRQTDKWGPNLTEHVDVNGAPNPNVAPGTPIATFTDTTDTNVTEEWSYGGGTHAA